MIHALMTAPTPSTFQMHLQTESVTQPSAYDPAVHVFAGVGCSPFGHAYGVRSALLP